MTTNFAVSLSNIPAATRKTRKNGRKKPSRTPVVKPFMGERDYGTLVVANEIQRIAFKCEMLGQISDGAWENSGPRNHWIVWSEATVAVAEKGEIPARHFVAHKCNYNFTRPDLLSAVSDRLIFRIKAHLVLGLTADDLGHNFVDGVAEYDWLVQQADNGDDAYWVEKLADLENLGVGRDEVLQVEQHPFDMKALRRELKGLKEACKTSASSQLDW